MFNIVTWTKRKKCIKQNWKLLKALKCSYCGSYCDAHCLLLLLQNKARQLELEGGRYEDIFPPGLVESLKSGSFEHLVCQSKEGGDDAEQPAEKNDV